MVKHRKLFLSEHKQRNYGHYHHFYSTLRLNVLAPTISQEKHVKRIRIRKEEIKIIVQGEQYCVHKNQGKIQNN